jgi:uncharacterized phage protein gp47/JayE
VSFAAEPYGVFVDDLVGGLTGGVVREEFVFLSAEKAPFRLAMPGDALAETVRVHGLVETAFHRFQPDTDYKVVDGTIVWLEGPPGLPKAGATWPDRGSHFYASYERKPEVRATPLLTDRNPGSVLRTLAESFAREYAVLSKQLDRVYAAGFLASAEGRDLEQVAALVGVRRRTRATATGEVVFSRTTPAAADIFIPVGTLLSSGEAPPITVETIEARTLQAGTVSVAVPVQSLVEGPAGAAGAGSLTVIHRPILGIESASNPQALHFGGDAESDQALRRRADRALEAGGRSTVSALTGALLSIEGVREQDIRIVEDHLAFPGTVKLTLAGAGALDDARRRRAAELITEYRPAGIRVLHNIDVPPPPALPPSPDPGGAPPGPVPPAPAETGPSTRFGVGVKAVVTPASASLTIVQKASLKGKVENALRDAVGAYGLGQTVVYNGLVAAVMKIDGVYDVSLDVYRSGGAAAGRTNLTPQPPDTRAELDDLAVSIRGALIALDVACDIQRLGLAASADRATALAAARDDIAAKLAAFVAALPAATTVTPAVLSAQLSSADYRVDALTYTAEFVDDGLRILQPDMEIRPDPEQQLWIRAVNVVENVTS